MHEVNVVVTVAAAVVIVLGLVSRVIKRSYLSVPLLALATGVVIGPEVLALLDPGAWPHHDTIIKEAARFTLAISVMGIAIRTPVEDFRRLLRPVALLLTFGMIGMWLASSALAWWILGLGPLLALLLGAVVTPTDPVVASSIVTGLPAEKILPDRLRSTLSLESGANDGLAYLIVLLPILLLGHQVLAGGSVGPALQEWLVDVLLIGVIAAVAIGAALGAVAGYAMRTADHAGISEKHSFLSFSVALSLLAVTLAKLAGADGIIAAFVAGLVVNLLNDKKETQEAENVQEAIGKLFNLPIFVLLGVVLPWAGWRELGLAGIAFAAAILLLRRPPIVLLLAPGLRAPPTRPDIAFLGWFGPIGVAAIYYAMLTLERTGESTVWHATSLVIAASVLIHGVTAAPGMKAHVKASSS